MEILGQSTKTVTPQPYAHLGYVAASSNLGLPIGAFLIVIGILQLFYKKKKYLFTSILAIVIGFLFVIISGLSFFNKPGIPAYLSGTNLKGIGTAIIVYAYDYDGKLPTSANWCDSLIKEADVPPNAFSSGGKDTELGESIYALNENVVNIKLSEIPADVVLVFETKKGIEEQRTGSVLSREYTKTLTPQKDHKVFQNRWNQVGGPQDITTDYHNGKGACVLFGDGHTEFVKTENISKLKWHPDHSKNNQ